MYHWCIYLWCMVSGGEKRGSIPGRIQRDQEGKNGTITLRYQSVTVKYIKGLPYFLYPSLNLPLWNCQNCQTFGKSPGSASSSVESKSGSARSSTRSRGWRWRSSRGEHRSGRYWIEMIVSTIWSGPKYLTKIQFGQDQALTRAQKVKSRVEREIWNSHLQFREEKDKSRAHICRE